MKAISVRDQDKLKELVAGLDDCADQVREAIALFNDAIAGPLQDLNIAVGAYDTATDSLRGFLEKLTRAAEGYLEDRSERWQESDPGAAYAEWAQSLSEAVDSIPEFNALAFEFEELCEPLLFDADSWIHPANAPGAFEKVE